MAIDYNCPICGKIIPRGDLRLIRAHTDKHIIDVIRKKHPDWAQGDGMCMKCYRYYKGQLKGE